MRYNIYFSSRNKSLRQISLFTFYEIFFHSYKCNIFLQHFSNLSKLWRTFDNYLAFPFKQFSWVITHLSFCPIPIAPFENIFCPQTRMQQKILTIVQQWPPYKCTILSAIFSLCFILLCNGWLDRPVGISKRFTLLYAIQENVFEALTNNGTLSLCLFTKWQKKHSLKLKGTFLHEQVGFGFCG